MVDNRVSFSTNSPAAWGKGISSNGAMHSLFEGEIKCSLWATEVLWWFVMQYYQVADFYKLPPHLIWKATRENTFCREPALIPSLCCSASNCLVLQKEGASRGLLGGRAGGSYMLSTSQLSSMRNVWWMVFTGMSHFREGLWECLTSWMQLSQSFFSNSRQPLVIEVKVRVMVFTEILLNLL